MKKILFLLVSFLLVFSCKDAEQEVYDGDALLNFNKGLTSSAFVSVGETYRDVDVSFGTIKAVSGDHQVKLVLDAANSTAVEGKDFQIVQNPVQISGGQTTANFKVRILETAATQTPKVAVFKLQSSTLPNAIFDQTYSLSMSLTCPLSYFIGNGIFKNTTAYWMAPAGSDYIVENITTGGVNQLKIKGYLDDGSDLVVNYNPATFAVSIPLQATGYIPAAGQMAYASDPTSGPTSSFNPCTRVLTLNVYWHVRNTAGTLVGGYNGNNPATEVFTGQ